MAIASDILTASFLKIGVEVPTTAQTASAFLSLNNMIRSWGAEKLFYAPVSKSKTLTAGTAEYTVGTTADVTMTARPNGIQTIYLRDSDGYDFPLDVLSAKDYTDLYDKDRSGKPEAVYFLQEYPLQKLIFDHAPDEAYTAYIEFDMAFTALSSTSAEVSLPGEYLEALVYNLAISLGEDWDRNIGQTVLANAVRTKDNVDRLNASLRPVPQAEFDITTGRNYDIVNDR